MPKNKTDLTSAESLTIADVWVRIFSYLSPQDACALGLVENWLYALAVESGLAKSSAYYDVWSKQLDAPQSMLPHFVKNHITFTRRLRQLSTLIWSTGTQKQKVRYARVMRAIISLGLKNQDERVSSLAKERQASATTLLTMLKESTPGMRKLGMLPFIAACLSAEQITQEISSALEKLRGNGQLTVDAEENACLSLACFFTIANEQERKCSPAEGVVRQLLMTVEKEPAYRKYAGAPWDAYNSLMAICAQPPGDSLPQIINSLLAATKDSNVEVRLTALLKPQVKVGGSILLKSPLTARSSELSSFPRRAYFDSIKF